MHGVYHSRNPNFPKLMLIRLFPDTIVISEPIPKVYYISNIILYFITIAEHTGAVQTQPEEATGSQNSSTSK